MSWIFTSENVDDMMLSTLVSPSIWNCVPSGYVKIAIENGHRNSGFTH